MATSFYLLNYYLWSVPEIIKITPGLFKDVSSRTYWHQFFGPPCNGWEVKLCWVLTDPHALMTMWCELTEGTYSYTPYKYMCLYTKHYTCIQFRIMFCNWCPYQWDVWSQIKHSMKRLVDNESKQLTLVLLLFSRGFINSAATVPQVASGPLRGCRTDGCGKPAGNMAPAGKPVAHRRAVDGDCRRLLCPRSQPFHNHAYNRMNRLLLLHCQQHEEQEVKVIWQKAPHGGPIPRLGVTPGGRKLYH